MKNSYFEEWTESNDYFSALAVLGLGPLHPSAHRANRSIISFINQLALDPIPRVCEIGLGLGWSHRFLNEQGLQVTSIEPDKFMRMAATRSGVRPDRIISSTVEEYLLSCHGIDDADIVIAQAVLGFIADPLEVFDGLLRKPGIKVIHIADWFLATGGQMPRHVKTSVTPSIYIQKLIDMGFSNIEFSTYVGPPRPSGNMLTIMQTRIEAFFPESIGRVDSELIQKKLELCSMPNEPKLSFILNASKAI